MANDKRLNYKGDPYTMQETGFSWDFKDSELIDFYTDKESGKINWDSVEQARKVRDGFMANVEWDNDPHISTSRKRGLADLNAGYYDYGKDPYIGKDGKPMEYPKINQKAYMERSDIRRTTVEDKIIDKFSKEDSIY